MRFCFDAPVYRTDWCDPWPDGLRFRIWVAVTPFGQFQRHEWLARGQNQSRMDEWIPGGSRNRRIPNHYRRVVDEECSGDSFAVQ